MLKQIRQCRLCGNKVLEPVLSLGSQALSGIFPKSRDQRVLAGPLELVRCASDAGKGRCGLVQLKHSCSPRMLYGHEYGYRSGINSAMACHLERKAREILKAVPLEDGDALVDIGSNDGTILKAFERALGPARASRLSFVGVDPIAGKFRSDYPGAARVIEEFFSKRSVAPVLKNRRAKVVTSIAMFYDVESPLDFMRQVSDILDEDGVWVFEQSYFPVLLKSAAYDVICHEHLEYYALSQIDWMVQRSDLKIVGLEFNDANGGSFSVTVAKRRSSLREDKEAVGRFLAEERRSGLDRAETYERFKEKVFRHRDALIAEIRGLRAEGKVIAGYGASTKGNVLLQFCGLGAKDLDFVVDINRDKWGCFTPGTLIPIVPGFDEAKPPDCFLVLPWAFKDNFLEREKDFLEKGGRMMFPFPEFILI